MAPNNNARTDKNAGDIIETEPRSRFALTKINFILMAIAGLTILIGFLLMLGGSSTTEAFNPDIFSTRAYCRRTYNRFSRVHIHGRRYRISPAQITISN